MFVRLTRHLVALLVSMVVILFLAGFGAPLAWGLLFSYYFAGIGLPILIAFLTRRIGPNIIDCTGPIRHLLVDSIQGMPDLLAWSQAISTLDRVDSAGVRLVKLQNRMSVNDLPADGLGKSPCESGDAVCPGIVDSDGIQRSA